MSDWKSGGDYGQPSDGGFKGDSFPASDGGMGGDGFQEVTQKSWFERIKQALVGVIIGLILIPGSSYLLFWNEGRAVTTARSLTEGAGLVQRVTPDRVDPAREGRLVHLTGPIRVQGELRDGVFPVVVRDAVRLVRTVEMYQWRENRRSETRTRTGGGQETVTTYSYERVWSSTAYNSSNFRQSQGHENPRMPYNSATQTAPEATIGAFRLTQEQLRSFGRPDRLPLSQDDPALRRGNAQVVDGVLYLANDPGNPRIGDIRVTFSVVRADQASVIGQQVGNGFGPYQTRAGDRLLMMVDEARAPEAMFQAAQDSNRILTWVLRVVGLLLMAIGFSMIMAPLGVLADVVPIFGSIVRMGTGFIAFALTFVLGPLVIAIAWFWFRPVVAAIVMAVGIAVAFGISALARRRAQARAARQPTMPPPPYPPQGPWQPMQGWGR